MQKSGIPASVTKTVISNSKWNVYRLSNIHKNIHKYTGEPKLTDKVALHFALFNMNEHSYPVFKYSCKVPASILTHSPVLHN